MALDAKDRMRIAAESLKYRLSNSASSKVSEVIDDITSPTSENTTDVSGAQSSDGNSAAVEN